MVKQYDDGYFINGEWFNGVHHNDPIINAECLGINVVDGLHTISNYTPSDKIDNEIDKVLVANRANHLYYDGNSWCVSKCNDRPIYSPDNAWSNGAYGEIEEPYDTKYITYLFYGIIVILVLAILFVLIQF